MDKLIGTVVTKQTISGVIGFPTGYATYTGEYEVTPTIDGETLETANKMMVDDLTVLSIPYTEVSNLGGGITVTIGGT